MADADVDTDGGVPPAAPSAAVRWLVGAVVGFVLAIGLAVSLGGGDAADDLAAPGSVPTDELVLPAPPVEVAGPLDPDSDARQGAAVVGLTPTGPGPEGLPDGTWITDVATAQGLGTVAASPAPEAELPGIDDEPVWGPGPAVPDELGPATAVPTGEGESSTTTPEAPDRDAATTSGGGAVTSSTSAPVTPSPAPGDTIDLGAGATAVGELDLGGATWQIDGVIDTCAEGDAPCPPGEPGTVLPFSGGTGGGGQLEVKAWPGLNGLTANNLGCEPGYRTSTNLPVVVTASAPVSWLKVTLTIDGGAQLDEVYVDVSDPAAKAAHEAKLIAGAPTGTDLATSFHHCFSLTTEAHPDNVGALGTLVVPVGARYRIDVHALAMTGPDQATATATHPMAFPPDRPPTTINPLTTHRAQVAVFQIGGAAGQTRVWAERSGTYADGSCATFGPGPQGPQGFETGWPSATPRKQWAPSEPYPYDRAYDHFTVWNLALQDTSHHVVCVQWRRADGTWGETETWKVRTPAALHLDVWVDDLTTTPSAPAYDHLATVESVATCNRWDLSTDSVDHTSGGEEIICSSDGWPVAATTKIQLEGFDPKTGAYHDLGAPTFLTPTVCPAWASPLTSQPTWWWDVAPCSPRTIDVTLVWGTGQSTLCGGPIGGCGGAGEMARAAAQLRFSWGYSTAYGPWPNDPTAWDVSLVDATYGTGLTGGGQSLP